MKLLVDKELKKRFFRKKVFNNLFQIILLTAVSHANALPNFSSGFKLENIDFYQDHEEQNLFYYMPNNLILSMNNDTPLFGYDLFRYVGRKMTGDAGKFRVRGVLTFGVEKPGLQETLRHAKTQLNDKHKNIIFRPVPIKEFGSTLIYSTTEANTKDKTTRNIDGGISKSEVNEKREGQWQQKKFTIGLQSNTAQLFWDNFQNDRLQLSLSYHWKGVGVVPGKNAYMDTNMDIELDESNEGKWDPAFREVADTIPINISINEYPALFRKNETWQKMTMGHTYLTVYCYDFINELKTDLYSVTVEVMFRTLRNQDYKEKVKFIANDDAYKRHISFRLAKDLDAGYKYRIKRLYQDGRYEKSKWQHFNGQHLDATYYVN